MPSGACVIRYDGKRGTTWRVKFVDADGRQFVDVEPEVHLFPQGNRHCLRTHEVDH